MQDMITVPKTTLWFIVVALPLASMVLGASIAFLIDSAESKRRRSI